jgi:hypothetical protein
MPTNQPLIDVSGRMSAHSVWRLNNYGLVHSGTSLLDTCGIRKQSRSASACNPAREADTSRLHYQVERNYKSVSKSTACVHPIIPSRKSVALASRAGTLQVGSIRMKGKTEEQLLLGFYQI